MCGFIGPPTGVVAGGRPYVPVSWLEAISAVMPVFHVATVGPAVIPVAEAFCRV